MFPAKWEYAFHLLRGACKVFVKEGESAAENEGDFVDRVDGAQAHGLRIVLQTIELGLGQVIFS